MTNLQQLYLHWNKISTKGALEISNGLKDCSNSLQVLDLSHNSIGALGEMLYSGLKILQNVKNTSLIHLDLSYNTFSDTELQEMKKCIQNN